MMSSPGTTQHRPGPAALTHPGAAAAIGVLGFVLAIAVGEVFDLNADPDDSLTAGDIGFLALLVAVGVAIAVAVGLRGRRGAPGRLAGTALGLAIAAAATFIVFWSGWPMVFGAVAVGLAVEHRRRVGSSSGTTTVAVVLGGLAFAAAAVVCVVG
jgi:hypothetical protein